jgi:hypothetical protein
MDYRITPTGALVFSLSRTEQADLADRRADIGYIDISEIFADSAIPGNSSLAEIHPEDVGALTSSPMFATDVVYADDGSVASVNQVWWYPNYAVDDPADRLIDTGSVSFTLGPKD